MKKHYDILFLAMSCNDPFFEMSRKVVHDTWAKDIIEDKYPGVGVFSYTSSGNADEYLKNYCMYVNAPDDIAHTYTKTIRALKMLKDRGVDWDCVVRTNTSTYINVPNMIDFVNKSKETGIGLTSFHAFDLALGTFTCPLPAGWLMCMSGHYTNILLEKIDELDENNPNWLTDSLKQCASVNDDVLFGVFREYLNSTYGFNIPFREINWKKYGRHYKSFIRNPFIQSPLEREGIYSGSQYTNPDDVRDSIALQVRLPGVSGPYRCIELEHMYELHEAYKNICYTNCRCI